MTVKLSKNGLRSSMKSRLAALKPQEYWDLNQSLYSKFLQSKIIDNKRIIMIYYSVRHEVDTVAIISYLLETGKKVALPVCTPERDLLAAVIDDLNQLQPAPFGLMEPGPGAALLHHEEIELTIIPGIAFDVAGHRLGHGKGYYDRFLSKAPKMFKLGLAYDFQVVPEIPTEGHDVKMDGLLTPTRYLEF